MGMPRRVYLFNKDGSPKMVQGFTGGMQHAFSISYDADGEAAQELAAFKAKAAQADIDKEVAIRVAVERALKSPKK